MSRSIGVGIWVIVVCCWAVIWIAFGASAFVYGGVLLCLLIVLSVRVEAWRNKAARNEFLRRHASR